MMTRVLNRYFCARMSQFLLRTIQSCYFSDKAHISRNELKFDKSIMPWGVFKTDEYEEKYHRHVCDLFEKCLMIILSCIKQTYNCFSFSGRTKHTENQWTTTFHLSFSLKSYISLGDFLHNRLMSDTMIPARVLN